MKKFNITSNLSDQTIHIASTLAKHLKNGDTVVLTGELGAGKTKFTEGFLAYFGLENEITSPTFNIVNEHTKNDINIYHFDVYRLADIDEFYAIGGEEYFDKGICIIEWGELIEEALPEEYIKISIQKQENTDNSRSLHFEAFGQKYELILDKLKEELI